MQLGSTKNNVNVPVILGSYVNAYSLVRGFAEVGIKSILAVWQDDLACYTRLADIRSIPDPVKHENDFLDSIVEIGKSLPDRGFLVCTDDATVSLTARYRDELERYYCVLGSSWDVLSKCVDKRPMYEAAEKAGVLIPFTRFCNGSDGIRNVINDLPYPCLIKPAVTVGFMEQLGLPGRTVTLPDRKALELFLAHLESVGLADREFIVQEVIPGGAEELYTMTAYCDLNTDIIAYSTGHKIRQHPPDAGTIISGKLEYIEDLFDPCQKLVTELGFQGICNIEFKKDADTGEYKLIEINARPGMWNYSATASGVNLAYIAYKDLLIEKVTPIPPSRQELVWIMTIDDLWNSVRGWRMNNYAGYAISFGEWLKSLKGRKVDPVFNLGDPGPWCYLFRKKILMTIKDKLHRNTQSLNGAKR